MKKIRHTENKYQNGNSKFLSAIIFDVNELTSPIKRQRLAEWIENMI